MKVGFRPDKEGCLMKVLVTGPGWMPYETEIAPAPEAMQALVSGTILAVYPFAEPVLSPGAVCPDPWEYPAGAA